MTAAQECNPKCHQLLADNHEWCNEVTGSCHAMPHLFTDILALNCPELQLGPQVSYATKRARILGSHLVDGQSCVTHPGLGGCEAPYADFGVSGLPCTDMSRAGKRQKRHGPTSSVYITHAKFVSKKKVPLFVLECTPATYLQYKSFCLGQIN